MASGLFGSIGAAATFDGYFPTLGQLGAEWD